MQTAASMFSPLWYRYAQLKPKLKPTIVVQTQYFRGQQWYVLEDTMTHQQVRINDVAYQVAGRLNGMHSMQSIWETVIAELGSAAPTQPEVIQMLNELDQKDVLIYDVMPEMGKVFKRAKRKKSFGISHVNPLSFRINLGNPDALLESIRWIASLLFNPLMCLLWFVVFLAGLLNLATNYDVIQVQSQILFQQSRFIVIAWLAFPAVKLFHEFAHAMAIKHHGGQVSEVGITMFMLTPAPFVDASAASRFRSKYQRVLVSVVGIMVDLFIASLALMLFLNTRPGLVHDVSLVIAMINSVSSLAVNGNPLLKFDAYHALCDWIEMPNLAQRSRAFWLNGIARQFNRQIPATTLYEGECKWLASYWPLSSVYMFLLFSAIVLWLAEQSAILGILAFAYILIVLVLKPSFQAYQSVVYQIPTGEHQVKVKAYASIAGLSLLALFFWLPIPNNTIATGVIWLPEEAQIRVEAAGFIRHIAVKDSEFVTSGQTLVSLENPEFKVKEETLLSQLSQLEAEQFEAMMSDPNRGNSLGEQVKKTKLEIARIHESMDALQVHSKTHGYWMINKADDLLNTYVKQGELLGYVLNQDQVTVRAVIPAEDAESLQNNVIKVEVKTASFLYETFSANIANIKPLATNTLPSPALGSAGGGAFMTDPKDEQGLTVFKPLVWVDLTVPDLMTERVGERVYVKFVHDASPIATQIYRYFKQLFLTRFNQQN